MAMEMVLQTLFSEAHLCSLPCPHPILTPLPPGPLETTLKTTAHSDDPVSASSLIRCFYGCDILETTKIGLTVVSGVCSSPSLKVTMDDVKDKVIILEPLNLQFVFCVDSFLIFQVFAEA